MTTYTTKQIATELGVTTSEVRDKMDEAFRTAYVTKDENTGTLYIYADGYDILRARLLNKESVVSEVPTVKTNKPTDVVLHHNLKPSCADFLRSAIFFDTKRFAVEAEEADWDYEDNDVAMFTDTLRHALNLLAKIDATKTGDSGEAFDDTDISVTRDEAKAYCEAVEFTLFDLIREDADIDNVAWLHNIMQFWHICCSAEHAQP